MHDQDPIFERCRKAALTAKHHFGQAARYISVQGITQSLIAKVLVREKAGKSLPSDWSLERSAERIIIRRLKRSMTSLSEQGMDAVFYPRDNLSDSDTVEAIKGQITPLELATVEAWLANDGDNGATASALGIFPNTLARRLSKMRNRLAEWMREQEAFFDHRIHTSY